MHNIETYRLEVQIDKSTCGQRENWLKKALPLPYITPPVHLDHLFSFLKPVRNTLEVHYGFGEGKVSWGWNRKIKFLQSVRVS